MTDSMWIRLEVAEESWRYINLAQATHIEIDGFAGPSSDPSWNVTVYFGDRKWRLVGDEAALAIRLLDLAAKRTEAEVGL